MGKFYKNASEKKKNEYFKILAIRPDMLCDLHLVPKNLRTQSTPPRLNQTFPNKILFTPLKTLCYHRYCDTSSAFFCRYFLRSLGVAPLFTNAVPGAIWRYFWPIMAAAFFLRVGVAVSSDWIYRSDELVQHLEQAHRLVFGYGIVPWDYHYGARNWLAIMPAATTLKLLQIMGLGHPTIMFRR